MVNAPLACIERMDSGKGLKVLVVEDDRDSADILATLIRMLGHEARVTGDGQAALAEARSSSPDVVLLDIGLPGMDGWEVAQELRIPRGPKRPFVVAITGYGQEADQRRSEAAGIDLHLVKPVEPTELSGLLNRLQGIVGEP